MGIIIISEEALRARRYALLQANGIKLSGWTGLFGGGVERQALAGHARVR